MWLILAVLAVVLLVGCLWWNRSTLHLIAANRAFRRKDIPAVLRAFARAEKAGRLGAGSTVSYAYLLLKHDEADEAEALLSKALEHGRKHKPLKEKDRQLTLAYWALVLWKRQRLEEAAEVLEGLLADDYRTGAVYGSLGYFLTELKQWDRAERVCREALDWDPKGKVIQDNWGFYLLARERWDEAAAVYDTLIALEPRFPEAWYNAGVASHRTGNITQAKERWERALELPFHALTTLERAVVEEALKNL